MKYHAKAIIEVQSITKRFGDKIAIDNISFQVNKGEIFGFLGPNGAGKTTTIRMVTTLLTPDSGQIAVDGIDISKNPIRAKMKMGVIPETSNIYTDLTAVQNLVLVGRFYGMSGKQLRQRSDSLLETFGLADRKNDPLTAFSKGMRQRVNIASAIVHEPEILFLDELTSGLDVQSQRLIKDIIKQRSQKGTTVFLTTHNIEEANQLCDRICIINNGKIAAIGTPENLKRTFKQTQSVEIAFSRPVNNEMIESITAKDRVEKLGDKWKLFTDDPDKLVKQLISFAQQHSLVISSLQICGASLEDAFIKLTEGKGHE